MYSSGLIHAHILIDICGIYVVFDGHICCWHIYSNSIVIESGSLLFLWLVCAVMWGLHVDHIIKAVGHTHVMWPTYLLGHRPVMWKYVCQCLWWCFLLCWVDVKYIYWHSCLVSAHDVIGFKAFEGQLVSSTYLAIICEVTVVVVCIFGRYVQNCWVYMPI